MSAPAFKDHFSGHAKTYRSARPGYPEGLFDWLAQQAPDRALAWDAGCGNGQASAALARHFRQVIATDPSAQQIAQAPPHSSVQYRVEPAETPSLAPASASLVTVAQAMHWFDLDRFYAAVRRIAKPGAALVVWSYPVCVITPEVDAVLKELYAGVLGSYWPKETDHANDGYARLPFPFEPLAPLPRFEMRQRWDFARFMAFLRSWSATQLYIKAQGCDPVTDFESRLLSAWGEGQVHELRWPVLLRAGRVG